MKLVHVKSHLRKTKQGKVKVKEYFRKKPFFVVWELRNSRYFGSIVDAKNKDEAKTKAWKGISEKEHEYTDKLDWMYFHIVRPLNERDKRHLKERPRWFPGSKGANIRNAERSEVLSRKSHMKIKKSDKKVTLVDKRKELASMNIDFREEGIVSISNWKAKVKGKGYGKKLMKDYIDANPDIWNISTDGLTEVGMHNIKKALPEFKIIDTRKTRGLMFKARLMSQSAIDYFIERQEKGIRRPIYVNPKLHSRYKGKKK